MNKLLIICGPTATGKTGLGVSLAKTFNGEIVSADSRQVYKGMDIVTGKDLPVNLKFKIENLKLTKKDKVFQTGYYLFDDVPVWMLDVVTPEEKFSVADYYGLSWKVINDIWERGKLPIIVGGTGLYIKILLEGLGTMGIEADWDLRDKMQSCTVSELQRTLGEIALERLERMNESDRNNPRRLIRAIEIASSTKHKGQSTKDQTGAGKTESKMLNVKKLTIGLTADLKTLYERIDKRVDERVKMGAKEEVKGLIKRGIAWNLPSMSALGYVLWKNFFEGKESEEEIIQKWKFSEHNYCRRQMTWFRKIPNINWFDIKDKEYKGKVEIMVKGWYS